MKVEPHGTKDGSSEKVRCRAMDWLNQNPADAPDLTSQAHWSVQGSALAFMLWVATVAAMGSTGQPAYQMLRYNENWSFLADPSRRMDWLDTVKFIPLDGTNLYLSLGGEARCTAFPVSARISTISASQKRLRSMPAARRTNCVTHSGRDFSASAAGSIGILSSSDSSGRSATTTSSRGRRHPTPAGRSRMSRQSRDCFSAPTLPAATTAARPSAHFIRCFRVGVISTTPRSSVRRI